MTRRSWHSLILGICLLLLPLVAAAQPFVILGPNDPIPQDRFIYAVLSTETNQLALGYSNGIDPANATRRVATRLPGHTNLLLSLEAWTEADLLRILDDHGLRHAKLRRHIGGGVVVTDNEIMVHPFHSRKAAGQLEYNVDFLKRATVNAQRPGAALGFANNHDLELLLEAVVERTGKPLSVTREMDSPMFPWNSLKHGPLTAEKIANYGAPDSLEILTHRINRRQFSLLSRKGAARGAASALNSLRAAPSVVGPVVGRVLTAAIHGADIVGGPIFSNAVSDNNHGRDTVGRALAELRDIYYVHGSGGEMSLANRLRVAGLQAHINNWAPDDWPNANRGTLYDLMNRWQHRAGYEAVLNPIDWGHSKSVNEEYPYGKYISVLPAHEFPQQLTVVPYD